LIGLAPASDRVVVEIERLGDLLAAPAVVKQKQGVRPSRQALLAMAVAQQRQQFSALARRKKPAANHASSRIRKPFRRKPLFAPSMSPGIVENFLRALEREGRNDDVSRPVGSSRSPPRRIPPPSDRAAGASGRRRSFPSPQRRRSLADRRPGAAGGPWGPDRRRR